jgi:hypothetical protein
MPISHIHLGDVIFTTDTHGVMHKVISGAQAIGSRGDPGHSNSVHVALATGNADEVYEAVGSGLKKRALKPGTYRVFCYRGPLQNEIREFAVWVAESHYAQKDFTPGYGSYNKTKATICPFRSLSKGQPGPNQNTQQFGEGGHSHSSFFCSNFVWRCYTAAGEAAGLTQLPIPNSYSQISPRDLEGLLAQANNWHARGGGQVMTHP